MDLTDELPIDQKAEIVRQHIAALREHFDSVQILCSHTSSIGTEHAFLGAGNWFARQGMAREFLNQSQSETAATELAKQINPPPDTDGEAWKSEH
jgi:hypothetical protein